MRRRVIRHQGENGKIAVLKARRSANLACFAATALLAIALTACVETVTKHGHQFQESDLQQISPGMS